MPRESMEKKVINIVNRAQEFIDDMVIGNGGEPVVINDNTYLTMCNDNAEMMRILPMLFERIKRLEHTNNILQLSMLQIKKSDWYLKNTNDPNYCKRQLITRGDKIDNHSRFRMCECGDWISKVPTYWEQHRKTEKCNSNRLRIRYEKNKFKFCKYGLGLDRLLLLDSHLRVKIEDEITHPQVYGVYCLESLILKWKQNRCRIGNMGKYYIKKYHKMGGYVFCEYEKYYNLLENKTYWYGKFYERV